MTGSFTCYGCGYRVCYAGPPMHGWRLRIAMARILLHAYLHPSHRSRL